MELPSDGKSPLTEVYCGNGRRSWPRWIMESESVDVGSVMDPIMLNMAPSPGKFEGFSLSKEVTLMTVTHFTQADLAKLLEIAASGRIDFETGTKRIGLDQINDAFQAKREGRQLRVMVMP